MINYGYVNSPLGLIEIATSNDSIKSLSFVLSQQQKQSSNPLLTEGKKQLEQYFNKKRSFFDLPLLLDGTDFQIKVWRALLEIPYGEVVSYSDIAREIAQPKAVRAVGGANNKNKIAIFIPCHRVIGKNASLTGYAGGLEIKQKLLALEGAYSENLHFNF